MRNIQRIAADVRSWRTSHGVTAAFRLQIRGRGVGSHPIYQLTLSRIPPEIRGAVIARIEAVGGRVTRQKGGRLTAQVDMIDVPAAVSGYARAVIGMKSTLARELGIHVN
jgi:hypothetical protein